MVFLISVNGARPFKAGLKTLMDSYGINGAQTKNLIETGAEMKSPITGEMITVDLPLDED